MKLKIAPSILSADFAWLGREVKRLEEAGADMVHVDVMDGRFVPNITIGPPVVRSLRKSTSLPLDVHLMIQEPEKYIDEFIDAGADILCVHAEATTHLHRALQRIASGNVIPAVSLNPASPLSLIEWILRDVGMVLLMSVNPGFGGQQYIPAVTEKIRALRGMLNAAGLLETEIEVDGGVSRENIAEVTAAGANVIVSGNAIFSADDMTAYIAALRRNGERAVV